MRAHSVGRFAQLLRPLAVSALVASALGVIVRGASCTYSEALAYSYARRSDSQFES